MESAKGTKKGLREDGGVLRCWWAGEHADYQAYHDEEWGRPVLDDSQLFEKLCLEGFQSGLSWLTILRKRENFRAAFRDFELETVSRFNQRSVERLLKDAGIVRHRGKIESAINNAKRALELRAEFGSIWRYCQDYVPSAKERPRRITRDAIPAKTPSSTLMSRDLKARGWSFVGPTTVYAFMQAVGIVNDHIEGCPVRKAVVQAQRSARISPERAPKKR